MVLPLIFCEHIETVYDTYLYSNTAMIMVISAGKLPPFRGVPKDIPPLSVYAVPFVQASYRVFPDTSTDPGLSFSSGSVIATLSPGDPSCRETFTVLFLAGVRNRSPRGMVIRLTLTSSVASGRSFIGFFLISSFILNRQWCALQPCFF